MVYMIVEADENDGPYEPCCGMTELLPHAWDTRGGLIGSPSSYSYQHCTDEAQKAETVLSAVSYI